ncbi:Hypothetical predicted protein [Podarcis lilfordi]|uniref:Uncharacterized protein n=1 Tax=Podarcis lilfordi TaxID=74358 RepID=A0AA35NZ40_9SAUR|nr:Hypothetical predicted protein [Podarcis lilfordi]
MFIILQCVMCKVLCQCHMGRFSFYSYIFTGGEGDWDCLQLTAVSFVCMGEGQGLLGQVSHIDSYAVGGFLSCWALYVIKERHNRVKASSFVCPHASFNVLLRFSQTVWSQWLVFTPEGHLQCLVMMILAAEHRHHRLDVYSSADASTVLHQVL